MVGDARIELAISCAQDKRHTTWLIPTGAAAGIRTRCLDLTKVAFIRMNFYGVERTEGIEPSYLAFRRRDASPSARARGALGENRTRTITV